MTRRYDITKGDSTSVGGTVTGGDAKDVLSGRFQAYQNDPVWCPVCKTTGKILCVGPRCSTSGPDGREAALSDDLCECHCTVKPKLVASLNASYTDA